MDEPKLRSRRDEHAEATREALIAAGIERFAEVGYAGTALEEIARSARVTRGAFYHHFDDKRALYLAVVTAMQRSAAERIEQAALRHADPREQLSVGIDTYLDLAVDPAYRRIVVQDAATVLGHACARAIEEECFMAPFKAVLGALKDAGELKFDDVGLLAEMIDAMICKLAVLMSAASDRQRVRAEGQRIIDATLQAFRT